MLRTIALWAALLGSGLLGGCTTIYGVAMDERPVGQQASDKRIEVAVFQALVDDPTVKARDISTYCFAGEVYLVGEIESAAQQARAEQIARQAEGVKSVTSYLLRKIDDPTCKTTDNLDLVVKVKAALVGDKEIWSTNVAVKAVQCRVVLLGIVGTAAEAKKAEAHARAAAKVRGVRSYLRTVK